MSCLQLLPKITNSSFYLLLARSVCSARPVILNSLSFHHMEMACSHTFHISFLKNLQPSCVPLPFRMASQVIFSIRLLNRPKSAFCKSIVAVLLMPLVILRIENCHFVSAVTKMASDHAPVLLCSQTADPGGHLP